MENYDNPRHQQLFKNIIYVGALAALINIEMEVLKDMVRQQFSKKEKLIPPNFKALDLGFQYVAKNYSYPLDLHLERRDLVGDSILVEGNEATGLGAVYAGATVAAWYPITPSTSVVKGFGKACQASQGRS